MASVGWSQQEFGIAASLSGDRAMMEAYESGDPYFAFGNEAGRIPPDGTKRTPGGRAGAVQEIPLWPFSTGWGPSRWPGRSASRRPLFGSCSNSITRPIPHSGGGRTEFRIMRWRKVSLYDVRWDGSPRSRRQPAFGSELRMPGQRGREDAVGVLSGDGERHRCRGPGSRRLDGGGFGRFDR